MYFSDKNFVKVELGIGKQKSVIDKRQDMQKKDANRDIRRAMKNFWEYTYDRKEDEVTNKIIICFIIN